MNQIVKCEKCGTPMIPFQKDGSQGMTCPKCGWGWATTYTTPIMLDENQYTLIILNKESFTLLDLKKIALAFHMTIMQTRKGLSAGKLSYTSSATVIKDLAHKLAQDKINYSISPEFPYEI
jgi:uncharacterized paraquat-inducible protein A